MTDIARKIAEIVNMLPEQNQKVAYEMIKALVRQWDPDYTKLTEEEAQQLRECEIDTDSVTLEEYMQACLEQKE